MARTERSRSVDSGWPALSEAVGEACRRHSVDGGSDRVLEPCSDALRVKIYLLATKITRW